MQCPRCQTTLPQPPDRFCPNCGADLTSLGVPGAGGPPPPPPPGAPPAPLAYGDAGYGAPGGYGGGGGYGGPAAAGGTIPWEERDRLGLPTALIENTKQVLMDSAGFYRRMPISGGIGSPLLYALIVGYIGLVASSLYSAIFSTVAGSALRDAGDQLGALGPYLHGGGSLIANLIFGPVFLVIAVFIAAGIVHVGCLLLAGGGRGFEATYRVVAYAQGAAIINVIPVCGGIIAAVYSIVLMVIGVSEAHGLSRGKAAAVVLVPMVVICCCCIGIPVALILGGVATAVGSR